LFLELYKASTADGAFNQSKVASLWNGKLVSMLKDNNPSAVFEKFRFKSPLQLKKFKDLLDLGTKSKNITQSQQEEVKRLQELLWNANIQPRNEMILSNPFENPVTSSLPQPTVSTNRTEPEVIPIESPVETVTRPELEIVEKCRKCGNPRKVRVQGRVCFTKDHGKQYCLVTPQNQQAKKRKL
jgi:hypothetical protein